MVSVVTIFLNAERFLDEAVASVFAQTLTDWELLLVDDGSTDGSSEIARRYAHSHPTKVRYLEHEGHRVSRAEFEQSMAGKMRDPTFHADLEPLLAGAVAYDAITAYRNVHRTLITRLRGEPWKGAE